MDTLSPCKPGSLCVRQHEERITKLFTFFVLNSKKGLELFSLIGCQCHLDSPKPKKLWLLPALINPFSSKTMAEQNCVCLLDETRTSLPSLAEWTLTSLPASPCCSWHSFSSTRSKNTVWASQCHLCLREQRRRGTSGLQNETGVAVMRMIFDRFVNSFSDVFQTWIRAQHIKMPRDICIQAIHVFCKCAYWLATVQ